MQKIWKDRYKIHTYEVDAMGRMSLPVLGNLLQESASRHATHLNWGYESLLKSNCIWVLTALKIQLDFDAYWNDDLVIHTWPSGKNRLYYFRDFRIDNGDGEKLGIATTNWIIIDINSRKPAKLKIPEPFDDTQMESMFDAPPKKWPAPDSLVQHNTTPVRFDDLDINNHVNNIRYFDWMLRSLDSEFRRNHRLHDFEVHFLAEAMDSDTIQILLGPSEKGYEHLLKREQDGKPVAQARSVWQP